MNLALEHEIAQSISNGIGSKVSIQSHQTVAGGCISQAALVQASNHQSYLVKWQQAGPQDMFQLEANGLSALVATDTIDVPKVVAVGEAVSGEPFLVLEAIRPSARASDYFETFGRQLAEMHRQGKVERFGFETSNYLGSSHQPNDWSNNWVDFWAQSRLGFQLELAASNKLGGQKLQRLGLRLIDRLESLIGQPHEPPALIHGDLWSGNYLVGERGQPVLIDPAVYYGSREAEFGMTTLFGGMPEIFYTAYQEVWPLADGWQSRVDIYRLYHLLNHLNLFGNSYLSGCFEILERYAR